MFCNKCGKQNEASATVCVACGAPLVQSSGQYVPPTAPTSPYAQPAEGQAAGQQQPCGQQPYTQPSYGQPTAQPYAQSSYAPPTTPTGQPQYTQPVYGQPVIYSMTEQDRNLRLVAFIFCVISTVSVGWAIIPLVWMIPMTVHSWGLYKGSAANTTGFGVCTLIFVSLVAGILMLISKKDA